MRLTNSTLDKLPEEISRPTYDRSKLTPGIVHIGLGNFHRAHQAWYLHRLMQLGQANDWAIIGAGVRPYDVQMREKLVDQDCLTTLIELDPSGTSAEVTGAMIDYVPIEEGNGALVRAMSDPAVRIVSLTVTEGGYYIDPITGEFDKTHEDTVLDAANIGAPKTAFGAIVAALAARHAQGLGPFTVQSCDNLQGNGAITRQAVVGLAKMCDQDLAKWIDETVSFPNSMVDCIVPATGPNEIALVSELGIEDSSPVTHENFRQWVIEDDFCAGRPDWDLAGATFTDNVHAYEAMKIRILNAGHQVLANVGEILNVHTIAECMVDPDIAGFFRKVQSEEIVPYIEAVPEISPIDYLELIERRFTNPTIYDTTRRVAFDGSSRHSGFVWPILQDAIQAQGKVEGLALVEAFWARMCAGIREDGSEIEPNDPNWNDLNASAKAAKSNPSVWLSQDHFYGLIAENPAFKSAFEKWLEMIWRAGSRSTIRAYLDQ